MTKVAKLRTVAGGKSAPPPPPAWLSVEAREEWIRIAPTLHRRGALTAATTAILESYCSAIGTVRQCEVALARDGVSIAVPNSAPKPHPVLGPKNRAAAVALQLAKRLRLFDDVETAKTGGRDDDYVALGID